MWSIIIPFANGYLGQSKAGTVWGKRRIDVINHLILINYGPRTNQK